MRWLPLAVGVYGRRQWYGIAPGDDIKKIVYTNAIDPFSWTQGDLAAIVRFNTAFFRANTGNLSNPHNPRICMVPQTILSILKRAGGKMTHSFSIRSFIGTHDSNWEDPDFYSHDSLEITIVLEGRGIYEWNGNKKFIESGHVVLIPAHMPHRFRAVTSIRFGVILMNHVFPKTMELFNAIVPGTSPVIIILSRLDKDQYELLFRQWLRILSSSLKDKERNYTAWLEVLLLFLLEHSHVGQQALTITSAADYIRENLQRPASISDLAELVALTEDGFRNLFYQVYGMSPKQYHQQCKMSEAKWLLSSTDKGMQEIAVQIGFSRLHSFSQWFKSLEGLSPSEWRKHQRMNFA